MSADVEGSTTKDASLSRSDEWVNEFASIVVEADIDTRCCAQDKGGKERGIHGPVFQILKVCCGAEISADSDVGCGPAREESNAVHSPSELVGNVTCCTCTREAGEGTQGNLALYANMTRIVHGTSPFLCF